MEVCQFNWIAELGHPELFNTPMKQKTGQLAIREEMTRSMISSTTHLKPVYECTNVRDYSTWQAETMSTVIASSLTTRNVGQGDWRTKSVFFKGLYQQKIVVWYNGQSPVKSQIKPSNLVDQCLVFQMCICINYRVDFKFLDTTKIYTLCNHKNIRQSLVKGVHKKLNKNKKKKQTRKTVRQVRWGDAQTDRCCAQVTNIIFPSVPSCFESFQTRFIFLSLGREHFPKLVCSILNIHYRSVSKPKALVR